MQRFILATILIAGTFSLNAAEKCYLEALNGGAQEYIADRDEAILKQAMREYHLLPKTVRDKFADCPKATFNDGCDQIFGEQNCETHGMVRVKKCEHGFKRIDTGLCVEKCPLGTTEDAGGAVCVKPKAQTRKSYDTQATCLSNHPTCDQFHTRWVSGCADDYKSLGPTMCVFKCPSGFVDLAAHCVPRVQHTPEYFLPRFTRPLEGELKEMEG